MCTRRPLCAREPVHVLSAGVHAAVVHVHVCEMQELRARDPCCG
jgi:hypothetical protein